MASTIVPLFGPVPGGMEMVVILLIAVLLFGANKIPKLARSSGEAIGEFQKGRAQVEQELEEIQEDVSVDEEDLGLEESPGGPSVDAAPSSTPESSSTQATSSPEPETETETETTSESGSSSGSATSTDTTEETN